MNTTWINHSFYIQSGIVQGIYRSAGFNNVTVLGLDQPTTATKNTGNDSIGIAAVVIGIVSIVSVALIISVTVVFFL